MNIISPPTQAEMTRRTSGWATPTRSTRMPMTTRPQTRTEVEPALVVALEVGGAQHVGGQPARVVDDAGRRREQREGADEPEEVAEPGADPRLQHLALAPDEVDRVRQPFLAVDGGVGEQRGEGDRDEGDEHEGRELLDVGEAPPALPARHVRGRRLEDVAGARRRLGLAGDRAGDPRHVAAHAEALVADPVRLAEVLPAAGAGEGERAEEQGEAELGDRDRRLGDDLRQAAQCLGADDEDAPRRG